MSKVVHVLLLLLVVFGMSGCSSENGSDDFNTQTQDNIDNVNVNADGVEVDLDGDGEITVGRPDNAVESEMDKDFEEVDELIEELDDLNELGDDDFDVSIE